MLTVDHYGRIRRAHRDGMTVSEIARRFHHSRRKVREVLRGDGEPKAYSRRKRQHYRTLGSYLELIKEILAQDEQAPPKQRHTMMQVFRRLRGEGYQGGYDAVRRYIRKHRKRQRETFIPLSHDPGQRLEADFGQIYVDFPEGRRAVSVLILVWSYSNYPRYATLASHYVFEPLFCMPARGNEKPCVENRVKTLQRWWSTPVPKVQDLDELNAYLLACCQNDRERQRHGTKQTIGEFSRDRLATVRTSITEAKGFQRRRLKVMGDKGSIIIQPIESRGNMSGGVLTLALEEDRGGFNKGIQNVDMPPLKDRYEDQWREFAAVLNGEMVNPYTYEHDYIVHKCHLQACGLPIDV